MRARRSGLQLCRDFYDAEVGPRLADLPHAAALLGRGSEVLGFDDEMSRDHDWRARATVFLRATDEGLGDDVADRLRRSLPDSFDGHPTEVQVTTVRRYFLDELAIDLEAELTARDWLTLPEHTLRTYAAGAVFHDEVGLTEARERLAHYPREVWLYLLMTGWWRVHPELDLTGRTGFVGDELGSGLLGAALVTDLMRLAFLIEREYAPYSKWFGTAFSRLPCGPALTPVLTQVVHADDWRVRERALATAYGLVADRHDALGITAAAPREQVRMWERPFAVSWADYPTLLRAEITDPEVSAIADRWPVGPVDRFRHLLWRPDNRQRLLRLFDEPGQPEQPEQPE